MPPMSELLQGFAGNRVERRKMERIDRRYTRRVEKARALGLDICAFCKRKLRKHPGGTACVGLLELPDGRRIDFQGSTADVREVPEIAALLAVR